MTQPQQPNMFIPRISGPLEMFSVAALLIGALFKLQSWPYASELWIAGALGLCLAYMVLLPIRLYGLKGILPKADLNYALATSIGLGLFIGSYALMALLIFSHGFASAISALEILRTVGLVVVAGTFVYDYIRTPPAPNTAQYMIAQWLRKRQTIIMVLIVISVLSRLL